MRYAVASWNVIYLDAELKVESKPLPVLLSFLLIFSFKRRNS